MTEIDFLPEWYKNGRRREFSYRTQYVALAGIFLVMVVWNFVASHSISKANAEVERMSASQVEAENASVKLNEIKGEIKSLQEKVKSVEKINSRVDVASFLAEMSYLIDERVVLNKVQLIAEKFADELETKSNVISAVRVAGMKIGDRGTLPVGNVRFKVVISGVANDASDVAAFVCRLEESLYFCNVTPLYSRNKQLQRKVNFASRPQSMERGTLPSQDSLRVSEFEISCYLENYREN